MPSPPDDSVAPVRASPQARRLAQEQGVDISQVAGTGPDGRITEDDVRAFSQKKPAAPPPRSTPAKTPPPLALSEAEQVNRLLSTANIQLRRGQIAEAERAINESLTLRPNDPGALELRGDAQIARDDYTAACESFRAALAVQPSRATAEAKLARAILRQSEQQRRKTLGVAYAASETTILGRGGAGNRKGAARISVFASAFLPGLGQILSGQYVKGGILAAIYGLSLLLLGFLPDTRDFALAHAGGHRADASPGGLFWFCLALS
ncbi:MAG: E3 binding domain-containing protein, partial [Armatimonadota bacterium]|nr:E3 binding domain-containing protein [Armatimonadota bacterium]